jgi:uncharacterized protein YbjQ (UPF0145 family)
MLITTTPQVEGKKIKAYLGLVSGEAIMGEEGMEWANMFI